MPTAAVDSLPPGTDRLATAASTVARLAAQRGSEADFLAQVVEELKTQIPARAVAVWLLNSQGVLSLATERGLPDTGITRDPQRSQTNIRRLLDVIQGEQAAAHPESAVMSGNPVAMSALFAPLMAREKCLGAVQIFLDVDDSFDPRNDYLPFVEETASTIAWSLAWREELASTTGHLAFWNRFERSVSHLGRTLESRLVAAAAVNEGRLLLECDRISVVVRRGRSVDVLAVTGQDRLHARAVQTRSLADLGDAVISAGRTLDSQSGAEGWPDAIQRQMFEHLRSAGARSLRIVPLREPEPFHNADDPSAQHQPPSAPVFGAMIFEQFSSAWLTPVAAERGDLFATHVARALHHALSHERIFLLRVRRWVGGGLEWFRGRTGAMMCAGVVVAVVLLAGLALVPATYRVEGRGKLMPAVQRDVFAPRDSEVTELVVQGGDRVEVGQPLLVLRDVQLETELLAARNRLTEKRQQLEAQQAEIDESTRRGGRSDDVVRLRGRQAQARVELNAAVERLESLEAEQERLTLRAPIAGTVASFQLEQELLHRPVRRGEVLLQVMDEESNWHLELTIPEHRMGHLLAARSEHPDGRLPVEFVLATTPETSYSGTLMGLSTRSSARPEEGAVVEAQVAVEAANIEHRRIGAEAVAKLDCGRKSLFYVLFGDVVELVERLVW
ncbi:MAG: HlyD family efflux transporter periplasmic adaptor subunit [Planctomycetota bacterium]|nr:HlyD family efflux transporter periplasmic adaptor subunit [Planctomycetota bacterium]